MSVGTGIDSTAVSVGAEFAVGQIEGDVVSFGPRVDEDIISIMAANDQAAADYVGDTGNAGMLRQTVVQREKLLERAMEDTTLGNRLVREAEAGGKNSVFSRLFGRAAGRDEALRLAYRETLPKIGYGALAVAGLTTGYYLYKKTKENNLFEETINQQPYENGGYVSQQNNNFVQINSPISSRRDPLTTAGVVGTLDRNKIGHTQMGPNKYNHLYGT